jgi:hypothetical protein
MEAASIAFFLAASIAFFISIQSPTSSKSDRVAPIPANHFCDGDLLAAFLRMTKLGKVGDRTWIFWPN